MKKNFLAIKRSFGDLILAFLRQILWHLLTKFSPKRLYSTPIFARKLLSQSANRTLTFVVVAALGYFPASLFAQQDAPPPSSALGQSLVLEAGVHYGKIIRHTPKITIRTDQAIVGEELGLHFRTWGQKPWHRKQHFPQFGLSLLHFKLGEAAHGEAFAALPSLSFYLARKPKMGAFFRIATGPSYITKPNDYFTNPTQNAIGSHWNSSVFIRTSAYFQPSSHVQWHAGFSFTHFSNGAAAQPNYGINITSGFLSLAYTPVGISHDRFTGPTKAPRPAHRWGALFHTGIAFVEYTVSDGPRYPIRIYSASALYRLNAVNRVFVGGEYEFNKAVYTWGLYSLTFLTEAEARRASSRIAVFAADEFLFGNVGIQLQSGLYVGNGFNQYVAAKFYNKLAVRLYAPTIPHTRIQPHIGIYLKAHKIIAEHISLNAGIVF